MAGRMETEKAVRNILRELRTIGLYEPSLEERLRSHYEQPDYEDPILVQREYGGQQVDFRISTDVDRQRGMFLHFYTVYVPAIYEVPEHFVRNGVDSAALEERMKEIDWQADIDWRSQDEYLSGAYRDHPVGRIFWEMYRFRELVGRNDLKGVIRGGELVNYLGFKYFGQGPMTRKIIADGPDLRELYYRELSFPPFLLPAVVGRRIGDVPELERLGDLADFKDTKNREIMNLNNLEKLREEMAGLGFSEKLMDQMEAQMKADLPEFKLYGSLPATEGRVDLTLHFKQSGKSDYYFFNKYEVCHEKGPSLAEGDHLMVATKVGQEEGVGKDFVLVSEALVYFKGQQESLKGQEFVSNLCVGDREDPEKLATMVNGKVNFVEKDFASTYRSSPINQTIYVEKGRGFGVEQAANLIQGRAVYRDDMVSQAGQQYKAWIKLDFDVPKDRFGNYLLNQYTDPAYGFDLSRVLDKFEIRELEDPAKRELLESSIRNGNRPTVTVEKDGKPVQLQIEASPRYSQINMFTPEGRSEKREQFLKSVPKMDKAEGQAQDKEKSRSKAKGMGV